MQVKMLIGRYAGEIRDITPIYARGLIARKEAEDPFAPKPRVAPQVPVRKAAPKSSSKSASRSRS